MEKQEGLSRWPTGFDSGHGKQSVCHCVLTFLNAVELYYIPLLTLCACKRGGRKRGVGALQLSRQIQGKGEVPYGNSGKIPGEFGVEYPNHHTYTHMVVLQPMNQISNTQSIVIQGLLCGFDLGQGSLSFNVEVPLFP